MAKFLSTTPAWFKFGNTRQEDVVQEMQDGQRDLDAMQERQIQSSKEEALPMFQEIVRDMDARPESMITENLRPWNTETFERVKRNRFKKAHPIRYLFSLLPFLSYGKYS